MDTREFLRRYAYVYCYVAAFFLVCAGLVRHSVEVAGPISEFQRRVIVIDAGHGAPDGGATGVSGTKEEELNLQIAKRLEVLLKLMGCETKMTRTGGDCIASVGDTIREKKISDLRNRVSLVNALESAVVVSIHQNHFPDGRYSGPQIFYTEDAKDLAAQLQRALSPTGNRAPKKAAGVYLMEHITHPGVLVECGFLSNAAEEQKLKTPEHQKRIAGVIAAVLAGYVRSSA